MSCPVAPGRCDSERPAPPHRPERVCLPQSSHGRAPGERQRRAVFVVRMGFPRGEMRGHGFRATARTLLAERLGVDEAVIEAQLAHAVKDALGRAYNRTEFVAQCRKLVPLWAYYLDKLCKGAEVVPIRRRPM